jgi:hypothetical protein
MKTRHFLTPACLMLVCSPAWAIDLSGYVGAYPFDRIDGYSFFDNPAVKSATDGAAGAGISDWLADLQVGLPIEQEADGLVAIVCEKHNCAGNNAAVAISVSGSFIAACLYSEDGEDGAAPGKVRWVNTEFNKQMDNLDDRGCPQDASQFLDAYSRILK